jgi:hypothetical protein
LGHLHGAEEVGLQLGARRVDGARASEVELRPMPALLTTIDTSPHVRAAEAMSSALFTSSRTG